MAALMLPDPLSISYLEYYKAGQNSFRSADDDLVYEKYMQMREGSWCQIGLVQVHYPKVDEWTSKALGKEIFVVEVSLTNLGEACLLTLKRGCCWNMETMSFDPLSTEDYYKEFLDNNHVPEEVLEMIERVDDPFLKPIKHDYIAFKLQASKEYNGPSPIPYYTIKEETEAVDA